MQRKTNNNTGYINVARAIGILPPLKRKQSKKPGMVPLKYVIDVLDKNGNVNAVDIRKLYQRGMSMAAIGRLVKLSRERIRQILLSLGVTEGRGKKKYKLGDIVQRPDGYVYVKVDMNTPGAYKEGMIAQHQLVMQRHLGRPLQKGEVIHHIDRDKANNSLDNLKLTTKEEHPLCNQCPYYEYYLQQTGLDKVENKK
ncbi:MAG: HNH endonuclease signature motif containing protein [Dehalococcoidales bacterium]|nr:HNH endonuclease signature motif containing protein [Dehalococcoidales bacterium]